MNNQEAPTSDRGLTPVDITMQAMETMRTIGRSVETALVGRMVKVTSDHNGQPFGRSKKTWRGEIRKITSVHIDLHQGISLSLEGHEYGECFIPAGEVEFL